MTKVFTPEHYRTAEQYGFDFESELPEAEILAEMDLTVDVLQGRDSHLSISRDDLTAYHFLHYGGRRGAGRFAVDLLLSGEAGQFIRSDDMQEKLVGLQERLSHTFKPNRLNAPLPLGRFSLSSHPIGSTPGELWLPEEFTDFFEGEIPAEPIPSRSPGPFLYPKEDVSLTYTGTSRTNTTYGRFMFNELADNNPALVDRSCPNAGRKDLSYPEDMPRLHLDEISVEAEGKERLFVTVSSEMVMLAVEPVA